VFVAGSTGNTGRRVVQQLRAAGYKVRAGVRVSLLLLLLPRLLLVIAPV
jgi:uncharacterized protein YbjT (DUF2867 family)